jgi:hypothetical protein
MSRCGRIAVLGVTLGLAGALAITGCDRLAAWLRPSTCSLSGRRIHPGMAVRLQVEGQAPGRACCLRCAISYAQQTGKTVRIFSVTDYVSHEPVPPERAVYVVGSTVTPCAGPPVDVPANRREASQVSWDRCLPSVIAFAKQEDAEEFRQQSGGEIGTFAELTEGTKVKEG